MECFKVKVGAFGAYSGLGSAGRHTGAPVSALPSLCVRSSHAPMITWSGSFIKVV